MKTQTLLILSVIVAVQVGAADAEKIERKPATEAPGRRPAGIAGPMGGGFERLLTEEQRQKLREHTQASGEKTRASQQEAMKLRRELQDAVLNDKTDEAGIKEKSEAIAKLESGVLAARMSGLAKVAATFTPEQKEKLKEMSEQVRTERPGLGAGPRSGDAPRPPREPAAPPPPGK